MAHQQRPLALSIRDAQRRTITWYGGVLVAAIALLIAFTLDAPHEVLYPLIFIGAVCWGFGREYTGWRRGYHDAFQAQVDAAMALNKPRWPRQGRNERPDGDGGQPR